MASGAIVHMGYTYKSSPYSSHAMLLHSLPEEGRGSRVLDAGCASGYLAGLLADRGYRVTGIERAGGSGDRFPTNVELIEADLDRGLPPLPGKFSYVICGDILEHLRDPSALLRQIASVLAPEGRLIASLPNSGNLYFRMVVLSGRFPQEDKGLFDRTHVRFYVWSGWRGLLAENGFQIAERQVTGIPVGLALARWEGSLAVRMLEAVTYWAARIWPTLFAYQFVVTAGRGEKA
jgi:SAM-dependent methyltransferase